MRNMVEPAAVSDFKSACAYDSYNIPKLYQLLRYCISCAVHSRIVHVRSRLDRKVRTLPQRFPNQRPTTVHNKINF